MLTTRSVVAIFSVAMIVLGAGGVSGQTTSTGSGQAYPNKPIRILASEAGGNGDFHARLISQGLIGALGQPVIVENRAALVAIETVAKATPDGYTLLVTGTTFWVGPLLQDMPYDPVRDFSPIAMTTSAPSVLVVHPSVPVKSVKELIALAKAKPGELNYAAAASGSAPHLAAELFKHMAGVNIVGIPYKGASPAVIATIGGQVQLMFAVSGPVVPHIKSGKLIALAVTTAQPSVLFPSLPTVAAAGLPGYEAGSIQGIWAPAKTSKTIITGLNREIARVLNQSDVKEKLLNIGVEVIGSSPEQFAATIKTDMARWGKVIKDAGIKAE